MPCAPVLHRGEGFVLQTAHNTVKGRDLSSHIHEKSPLQGKLKT